MSEDNIAVRLKFLIDNLGITSSQFADKCDIARPTLSQLLTGRNKKISNIIIEQIHNAYPGLSVLWLMFGEGEMWTAKIPGVVNNLNNKDDSDTENDSIQSNDFNELDENSNLSEKPIRNPCENRETRSLGNNMSVKPKENGVNYDQKTVLDTGNENINGYLCGTGLLPQIGESGVKARKVVQVTIYFDDSTFQTFYPN
ncbi:MAG: helix-turn-helix transcriptional regulator [Bacteroides sp.]|nr:helix-turn-helix transcriptional regulator [Bacteroides sp.]